MFLQPYLWLHFPSFLFPLPILCTPHFARILHSKWSQKSPVPKVSERQQNSLEEDEAEIPEKKRETVRYAVMADIPSSLFFLVRVRRLASPNLCSLAGDLPRYLSTLALFPYNRSNPYRLPFMHDSLDGAKIFVNWPLPLFLSSEVKKKE